MQERELLHDILVRLVRTETRVRNIQFRTINLGARLMAAIDDLKISIDKYIADVDAFRKTVKEAVDAAVAADDAGEDVVLADMKATIDAADAAIVAPVVPPVV